MQSKTQKKNNLEAFSLIINCVFMKKRQNSPTKFNNYVKDAKNIHK